MIRFSQNIVSFFRMKVAWKPKCSKSYGLLIGFCSLADSAELPDWFRFPEGQNRLVDSNDDFVLPTKLEFLKGVDGCNSKACSPREADKFLYSDGIDVYVDEICSFTKPKLGSPEDVLLALNSCDVPVSKDLVDKTLMRLSNEWIRAFGFFVWASTREGYRHSSDSYDLMVDILGKFKQFDYMWGLVDEMVRLGDSVSLKTLTKVMRRLAGAGRWGDAIKVFHDIELFGVKKDTSAMNVLLDTLCKERSVQHASRVFSEIRVQVPPNASSFNSLIHGWCKTGRLEEARRVMEEMKDFGFNPCVITYTSLIEAYSMEKNFQMVDDILHEMYAKGCPPNVVTYTIVMHSLGKAKKTQEALEVFEKNFQMVDDILHEMYAKGCPPNVVTYTIVMHSLGKAKKTQEALEVFEKMKTNGCTPDTSFYNSLIYILGRAGRLRDANSMYEDMHKSGIPPNVTTFHTLISAACSHSQVENAFKLLFKMQECSLKPDVKTYTPLLRLCCKQRWVKILWYLLAHMFKKDASLDLGTYTLLVHGLCRTRKLKESCYFFEEMVVKGFIPKQHTCNTLIEALHRKGMERAKLKVRQLIAQAEQMKFPAFNSNPEITLQPN